MARLIGCCSSSPAAASASALITVTDAGQAVDAVGQVDGIADEKQVDDDKNRIGQPEPAGDRTVWPPAERQQEKGRLRCEPQVVDREERSRKASSRIVFCRTDNPFLLMRTLM